jgi:hypothetical protein
MRLFLAAALLLLVPTASAGHGPLEETCDLVEATTGPLPPPADRTCFYVGCIEAHMPCVVEPVGDPADIARESLNGADDPVGARHTEACVMLRSAGIDEDAWTVVCEWNAPSDHDLGDEVLGALETDAGLQLGPFSGHRELARLLASTLCDAVPEEAPACFCMKAERTAATVDGTLLPFWRELERIYGP